MLSRSRENGRQCRGDLRQGELDRQTARKRGAHGLDEARESEAALSPPRLGAWVDGTRARQQRPNAIRLDQRPAEKDHGKRDEKRSQMRGRSS